MHKHSSECAYRGKANWNIFYSSALLGAGFFILTMLKQKKGGNK